MKLLSATTWEDIFQGWKEREAADPGWIKTATEVKGWPDWETWRCFTAEQIGAEQLTWEIQEFSDPMIEIPAMLIGPYSGWQSRVINKNQTTFKELTTIPEQFEYWKNVRKINSMINDFPQADMIGLIRGDNGKLVCIEGHHRATAVAIAAKLGQHIDFKKPVRIAVAHIPAERCENLFAKVLQRGTTKS